MGNDVVVHRGVQQVLGVEVEAAPVDRGLRGPLQQLAGGVAEQLGHVHLFDPPIAPGGGSTGRPSGPDSARPGPARIAEEARHEVVEHSQAAEA
jgi:hypothetical protein